MRIRDWSSDVCSSYLPAHRVSRRTHAVRVGRLAGHIRRQGATTFHHDAQAAETEDHDLDRRVLRYLLHLGHRQHARQDGADYAEMLVIKIDGLVIGGGTLHRQMQTHVRMPATG